MASIRKKKHPAPRKKKFHFRHKLKSVAHKTRRALRHPIKTIRHRRRHYTKHHEKHKNNWENSIITGAILAVAAGAAASTLGIVPSSQSLTVNNPVGQPTPTPLPSPIPLPSQPPIVAPVYVNQGATITLNPNSFNTLNNTQLVVSGTGLLPNQVINFLVNGSLLSQTTTSTASGSFSITLSYPSNATLATKINNNVGSTITVGATDGTTIVQTQLPISGSTTGILGSSPQPTQPLPSTSKVNPTLTVSYNANLRMYNVTGSGFTPNGRVIYAQLLYANQWNSAINTWYTTADANGNITINATPIVTATSTTPTEALDINSGILSNSVVVG
jgi:hypothetical protein